MFRRGQWLVHKAGFGPAGKDALRGRMRLFARNEDGTLIILGLVLLFLMTMMGGLAVDLMRHENMRVSMQQTLDRSVLAAASLTQEMDPEDVVRDYFDKAGLSEYLSGVTVNEGLNFREVRAYTTGDSNPFFMQMVGVPDFEVAAGSSAEQRINDVEISLVLDVSGSMGSNSRLTNLKSAAKEFIDTVINDNSAGRTTVSIIPYAGHVNLGQPLMDQFNVPVDQTTSYCVDLPASVYTSTQLSRTTQFRQGGHFDPYSNTNTQNASNWFCKLGTGNIVTALSDNRTLLRQRIDQLSAGGNTSIDIGMKWGTLLVDPSAQPVVQGLVEDGVVEDAYANRPLDPDDAEVLKIIVLMSDGENTNEYYLRDAYRSGTSDIWRRNSDGRLSLYYNRSNTNNDYYDTYNNTWLNAPIGGTSGATRLTWPQVWQYATANWVAERLYKEALGNTSSYWQSQIYGYNTNSTKNTRLQQVCTAARNAGLLVFTIAFEAPSGGQTQLRNCATTTSYYFNAQGLDVSTAFRAIASQISQLRLTPWSQ